VLKSNIEFHLADDTQLLVSANQSDYPPKSDFVLTANGATGLKITGTGRIDGRAEQFMRSYSKEGEIWIPGDFRPKIFVLVACKDLEVRDITFAQAPQWGLHMLRCERVLVDGLKIRKCPTATASTPIIAETSRFAIATSNAATTPSWSKPRANPSTTARPPTSMCTTA
jgi:polygalacturonase